MPDEEDRRPAARPPVRPRHRRRTVGPHPRLSRGCRRERHRGGLEAQTREALAGIEALVDAVDGARADLVRVRIYVNERLDADAYDQVNAARRDFFPNERHYPASTVLEVTGLVADDYSVEVEAEAVVPDDGWTVEVVD